MLQYELTGNKRYRVLTRPFRNPLIVLQVEKREFGWYSSQNDLYDNCSVDIDRVYYRDAQLEDLTVV